MGLLLYFEYELSRYNLTDATSLGFPRSWPVLDSNPYHSRMKLSQVLCSNCHHIEKNFFLSIYMRWQILTWTYCGNHFTIWVSQIIILYNVSLHSVISQLYHNKTGKINKHKNKNLFLGPQYFLQIWKMPQRKSVPRC